VAWVEPLPVTLKVHLRPSQTHGMPEAWV